MKSTWPAVLVFALACSCGQPNLIPTPSPAATAAPTQVRQTESDNTPTAQLPEPSLTPQAPATQPAQPGGQLAPTGPWLILNKGEGGLWALNPDGSGLTQLFDGPVLAPAEIGGALSPVGGQVAFVTADDVRSYAGLRLMLASLPSGAVNVVTPLFPHEVVPFTGDNFGSPELEAARSIVDYDPVAWSPDGAYLAFISAHDGPSSDVYVYETATGEVLRLTDGPSQAYGLSWSPDSFHIVHAGVSTFGTGAGYGLEGLWAVPLEGPVKTLPKPTGGDVKVLGWIASNVFLVHGWSVQCGEVNLRFYDLLTGAETALAPGCFSNPVFDPRSHALGFIVGPQPGGQAGALEPGLYVVPPESVQPRLVAHNIARLEWSVRFSQFQAFGRPSAGQEALAFSPGGAQAPFMSETFSGLPETAPVYGTAWLSDFSNAAIVAGDTLYLARGDNLVASPAVNMQGTQSLAWLEP